MVDLIDCYQYEDDQVDDVDAFTREPYVLYFKPHNTGQSLHLLKLMVPDPVRTRSSVHVCTCLENLSWLLGHQQYV